MAKAPTWCWSPAARRRLAARRLRRGGGRGDRGAQGAPAPSARRCAPRAPPTTRRADAIGASLAVGRRRRRGLPAARRRAAGPRRAPGSRWRRRASALERFERYGDVLAHIGARRGLTLETPEALHDILGARLRGGGLDPRGAAAVQRRTGGVLLVSASDDPSSMKVPLKLERYPEVRACMESREPVLVEDAQSSALLGEWAELAAEKGGRALLAVPLIVDRKVMGALLLRHYQSHPSLPHRAVDFLRMASLDAGAGVARGARVRRPARADHRMSLARYNEERRNRALDQYKDFFEAPPTAWWCSTPRAHVAAREPRRAADDRLRARGSRRAQHHRYRRRGAAAERSRASSSRWPRAPTSRPSTCSSSTTSGEILTVSVVVVVGAGGARRGGAGLPRRHRARALEAELRKTKDFLERLIDSTVDGIIAADMRGNVIIFNQGAARLYGYAPDEVIGKLPVWQLYPDGVARAIMSELRSERARRRRAARAVAPRDRDQGRRAGAGARWRRRSSTRTAARSPPSASSPTCASASRSSSAWRRRRRSWW